MASKEGDGPHPSPLPGTVAGRYRVSARLGRGGMGTVWRATDELLHRQVAVKELHLHHEGLTAREFALRRERALREARSAAQIRHPHVVVVHDVVEHQAHPWIVMELIDGDSLAGILEREGPLEVREAARLGAAMAAALQAAHDKGVHHRDVKPANVLVERGTGRAVLTDFGIARVSGTSTISETGAFVGSPEYTAPERMSGRDAGLASDLWSLGVLLCAAVLGQSPFRRDSIGEIVHAVAIDDIVPPASLGALQPVIARLLDRDPEVRLGAEQAHAALSALARGAAPPAARSGDCRGREPAPDPAGTGARAPHRPAEEAPDGRTLHLTEPHTGPARSAPTPAGPTRPAGPSHSDAAADADHADDEEAAATRADAAPTRAAPDVPAVEGVFELSGTADPAVRAGATRDTEAGLRTGTVRTTPRSHRARRRRRARAETTAVGVVVILAIAAGAVTTLLIAHRGQNNARAGAGASNGPADHGGGPPPGPPGPGGPGGPGGGPPPYDASAPPGYGPPPGAPGTPPLPQGYRLFRDPAHFALVLPEGYVPDAAAARSYRSPDATAARRLRLAEQDRPAAAQSAYAALRARGQHGPATYPGYRGGSVTATVQHGKQAALWEFTYDGSGRDAGTRLIQEVLWSENGRTYELTLSAPAARAAEGRLVFETVRATFWPG
ncbi:serine/threonine-protein kinase [Streptomyces sp. V4-01]|uniref:non-specific serine/threonine protein kinase n=1 Tax=Actinacidiphila polyblastidii TaxID=3110430 RepID=A0ABU7PG45_9ACTN|nr:serine/threonine-protein kinase [Streptomyces sp. V4-01]